VRDVNRRPCRWAALGILLLSSPNTSALSQTQSARPVAEYADNASYWLASLGLSRKAPNLRPTPLPQVIIAPAKPQRKEQPHKKLRRHRYPLVVPTPRATRAWRRTFRILRRNPAKTDRYDKLIEKYAAQYGLDPRLLKAIMAAESEFRKDAVSPAGAIGLMQVMPRTGEWMGVPRNKLAQPEENIKAGAAYLHHLFSRAWRRHRLKGMSYRDAPLWLVQRIIAAYNAGPRFLYRDRWYRETRRYVRKVLLFYRDQVTDIRRVPESVHPQPRYDLIRSSSGVFH
jgi:soluble lytic murein transglycosylase-like protein